LLLIQVLHHRGDLPQHRLELAYPGYQLVVHIPVICFDLPQELMIHFSESHGILLRELLRAAGGQPLRGSTYQAYIHI